MKVKDSMFFVSLASGSSGNCSYIGTEESGFLVDAGIPYGKRSTSGSNGSKTLRQSLAENNIDIKGLKGLIISHCHSDHIRFAADYCSNDDINIPVYICENTHRIYEAVRNKSGNNKREYKEIINTVYFESEREFKLDNFSIFPVGVSHDSYMHRVCSGAEDTAFAFIIKKDDTMVSIITDLGEISEKVSRYSANSRILHLEFNYDPEMLLGGKYPVYLKKRIRSRFGHLSNQDAVRFIMDYHLHTVESVSIAHVSRENNSDESINKSIEPIAKSSRIRFFKTYHGHYSDKIYF